MDLLIPEGAAIGPKITSAIVANPKAAAGGAARLATINMET